MNRIKTKIRRELNDLKQSASVWRIHSADELISLTLICVGLIMWAMV